jgi:hypothetical protein
MPSPGYSGTPLAKKLGIAAGAKVLIVNEPTHYRDWLAPLPDGVDFVERLSAKVDVVHLFTIRRDELAVKLIQFRSKLPSDKIVWVSWPKKAAKLETEVTEDVIRAVALPHGWVDVKVCAVSDIWSGLKLVVRLERRDDHAKVRS